MLKKWTLILILLSFSGAAWAQEDISEDDAYDPFADYSEFEAGADEEADIHFFKNGRFFNMGFMLGGRLFTDKLGTLTDPSVAYGFNFTYFFDLRTALQVSYSHSEHSFNLPAGSFNGTPYDGFTGNMALSNFAVHMKYYFNTANITRGFADMNPFVLGGFGMNYRTTTIVGEDVVGKSNPTSVELGGGLEIPIARKKMYLGLQGLYHYVNFSDEGSSLEGDDSGTNSGVQPKGDYLSIFMVLGINF